MKFLGSLVATCALALLFGSTTMTMTGCSSVVDPNDSTEVEELNPPVSNSVALTVLSATSAKISFTGSNNESSFRGYILLAPIANAVPARDTIVDSVPKTAAFSGAVEFTVAVNRDIAKTWRVAAYNKSGERSGSVTIAFAPRGLVSGLIMNKSSQAGTASDGMNISGTAVTLVDAADTIKLGAAYDDNSGADFIIEKAINDDSAFVSAVNGAFLINLPDSTTILTQAEITAAIAQTNKTAVVAAGAGAYLFASGSSVRVGGNGAIVRPKAGQCYLLIADNGTNYVRIIFDSVTAKDAQVTMRVYTKAPNAGFPLYKKNS